MFNDKIIIVTGGANGIGKCISETFAKLGGKVIIIDIDKENGEKLSKEINGMFYYCDLRNVNDIDSFYQWLKNTFGKADILINNAGVSRFKSLYEITPAEFDDVINTNLRGTFIMSQGFAKLNRGTKYGRIINISSTRYLMSEPNSEAYAASKGGIVSLTHALALSLAEENITVNCISPGWIETRNYDKLRIEDHLFHPSKRVGKVTDIANLCVFLCQEENDFINGENIIVDGGVTKKMIYND
ncbi:MAG: SDR family oxidoreductase [Bacilli bacterium]|nr:SDR family oxidoreductase [Bacilli bacterium]